MKVPIVSHLGFAGNTFSVVNIQVQQCGTKGVVVNVQGADMVLLQ